MIVHRLNRLEDVIAVHRLDPYRDERSRPSGRGVHGSRSHGWAYLGEAYAATDPGFEGRISVPVLWDAAEERIVNNESADIVRILDLQFGDGALHPEELRTEMERRDRGIVAESLQNAVYEAGFAGSQEAYEEAAWRVFATLEWLRGAARRAPLPGGRPDHGLGLARLSHARALRRGLRRPLPLQPAAARRFAEPVGVHP